MVMTLLTCGNDFLSCGNDLLTCGNNSVSCSNDLLTCGNNLVSCGNDFLSCGNDFLSCGNKIKNARKTVLCPFQGSVLDWSIKMFTICFFSVKSIECHVNPTSVIAALILTNFLV